MKASWKGKAVITGASSGIGAIAADRLAKRGHDLILVARNRERLDALATRLRSETGRSINVMQPISMRGRTSLVLKRYCALRPASLCWLATRVSARRPVCLTPTLTGNVDLNVTALVRLTYAALLGFLKREGGAIINIGSAAAIVPQFFNGVYSGTKAGLRTLPFNYRTGDET